MECIIKGVEMVKNPKIYAGIVSFNPDIKRLKENIEAIYNQVPRVLIFDNGSNNIMDLMKLVDKYNNVSLLKSKSNTGIAAALNRLMEWGLKHDFEWMLSLDQDSVCDDDYVNKMVPYLFIEKDLGIVAPIIVDRNVGIVGHNPSSDYSHVNTCITSGAFSRVDAWSKIGKYDESMFIDSVDFEYCYRMKKNGYGVIQVRDVKLLHEIGKSEKKRFLFWKINVTGHSAFRKYYIARNNVYYPLKHHLWLYFIRGNIRNLRMIGITVLYENNKKDKIISIFKGWINAYECRKKNEN